MTIDKPGQEQRMETIPLREKVEVTIYNALNRYALSMPDAIKIADAVLAIPELTRPTADLGEDGELVERNRRHADVLGQDPRAASWVADIHAMADRLILYRDARARLSSENARLTERLKQLSLDVLGWWKTVFGVDYVHTLPSETPEELAHRAAEYIAGLSRSA